MAGKILKGLGKIGAFGILGSSLLSSKKKAETPAPAPTTPAMPIADDEEVRRAKRRSIAAHMQRSGRASTILSESSSAGSTLGG